MSAPLRHATASSGLATVAYRAPVDGMVRVVRPFQAPLTRYGPGHRGVDLAATASATIRAAGAGTVTFAGMVAGRGLVVVRHPDGITTEYEPIRPDVRVGQAVLGGQAVGQLSGRHPGCAVSCVHWGARRAGAYLDPMGLLRALGLVHLLPDGPSG